MECTDSLSIETHDFGERLSNYELEALIDEISDGGSINIEITGHEPLVSSVKEWLQFLLSANLCNFHPLLHRWVDSCWVMSTGMQKNVRPGWCSSEVSAESLEI
jgi:hypothetical protein